MFSVKIDEYHRQFSDEKPINFWSSISFYQQSVASVDRLKSHHQLCQTYEKWCHLLSACQPGRRIVCLLVVSCVMVDMCSNSALRGLKYRRLPSPLMVLAVDVVFKCSRCWSRLVRNIGFSKWKTCRFQFTISRVLYSYSYSACPL